MSILYSYQEQYFDIENFLHNGGILLRQNIGGQGEFVVEKLSIGENWNVQLICESPECCKKIINTLVSVHPTRFMAVKRKLIVQN